MCEVRVFLTIGFLHTLAGILLSIQSIRKKSGNEIHTSKYYLADMLL